MIRIITLTGALFFCMLAVAQQDTITIVKQESILSPDSLQNDLPVKIVAKPKVDSSRAAIDSLSVSYFQGSVQNLKLELYLPIDTGVLNIHQFDPVKVNYGMYSTLSNVGLAQRNLVFVPNLNIGYDLDHISFSRDIYKNSQVRYYKIFVPYTEAEYVFGANKESNFNIIFTRELIKRFTIGVDFALNNSLGVYTNSKADDKRVFFTGQYYTKNARYGVIGNYLYNKLIVEENGGITYDSVFEQNLEEDRSIMAVNLTGAQNTVKQSGFFIQQYFNLLKPARDSSYRKIDAGSISYSLSYLRNQMIYSDPDSVSSFYAPFDPPLDSAQTFDSIYQMRLRNTFEWSSIGYHDDPASKIFYIYFGLNYDYIQQAFPEYTTNNSFIYNALENTSYTQLGLFGGIGLNIRKSFKMTGYAEFIFGDYNGGDSKIIGTIDQYLGNEDRNIGRIHAGIEFVTRAPSWYFQQYQSNFYRWNNSLKKENYMLIYGDYIYKWISAGLKFYTFGNYTYFDEDIRPAQLTNTASVFDVHIQGTVPVWKFGINTRLVYQANSNPGEIKIPDFTGVMNLFFRSQIFKKAATVQTGFELSYFTSFYANNYMPALRDWYNQGMQEIGDYILADVYLTLEVKQARLFIKYAHFNSLFGNYDYYLAPNYPARDARFYFGVNWRFHY